MGVVFGVVRIGLWVKLLSARLATAKLYAALAGIYVIIDHALFAGLVEIHSELVAFGYGKIRQVEGNKLTGNFDKAGEKRVIENAMIPRERSVKLGRGQALFTSDPEDQSRRPPQKTTPIGAKPSPVNSRR